MNEMIQFTYNAMECPIMLDDQKNPWWIAKNVCDILGLTNITMALSRIDDDEKLTSKIFISGQRREVWLINEPGLYSLVLTSNKLEAKAFKRWITHEVLPAIRKTGSYAAGEPKPVKPSLKEAADFMREARLSLGVRSARRAIKHYLGPENFEPLSRRSRNSSAKEPTVPLSEYKKVWPWGVSPEEEEWFLNNWDKLSEADQEAFIARAARTDLPPGGAK
jgi:prophage antirepressor-like protein